MRPLPLRLPSLLLCLLIGFPLAATEPPPRYDRINLSAEASGQADNDTLIAHLAAQKEGSDPVALSNSVNQLIGQAISQVKQNPDIKLQTLGYQTSPIYQQQRLSGWRVKQSLRLESRSSEVLSQLLSRLQEYLALESISYAVSDELRKTMEETLIKQALAAFQERARLITEQMGRSSYRLVEMTINSSDQPLQPARMRAGMMAMEASVSAPSLEAGSQTLRIQVNGSIELSLE